MNRRDLLKGVAKGVTLGTGITLTTDTIKSGIDEAEQVKEHLPVYRDFLEEVETPEQLTPELPIGLGEFHRPANDMFLTMERLAREKEPEMIGIEGLVRDGEEVEEFNRSRLSPREMAMHYQAHNLDRDMDNLISFYKTCNDLDIKIGGLEHPDIDHEKAPKARASYMMDTAEELHEESGGSIMFGVGFAHLQPEINIPYANLQALSLEELEDQVTTETIEEDPYEVEKFLYREGKTEENISFYSEEKYTLDGRIENLTSIHSTSPVEQSKYVQNLMSGTPDILQNWSSVHLLYRDTESAVIDMQKTYEKQGPYLSTTNRNYTVAVEKGLVEDEELHNPIKNF